MRAACVMVLRAQKHTHEKAFGCSGAAALAAQGAPGEAEELRRIVSSSETLLA